MIQPARYDPERSESAPEQTEAGRVGPSTRSIDSAEEGGQVAADSVQKPSRCLHCGLPLGKNTDPEFGPFCCAGCRTVHGLIHDSGLERFYDLRQDQTAPAAELRPDSFAWLPDVLQAARVVPGGSAVRLQLDIQGVHCAACVWLLEQLFAQYRGGQQLIINPAIGTVALIWDQAVGDLREYLAAAERFGYRFGPPRKQQVQRSRGLLVRMGICLAAAMNTMMFSLSFYLGLAPQDGAVYSLFGWLNFSLATLSLLVGGWPFVSTAGQGLRRRVAHLDLPIAVGMLLAYGGSVYTYLTLGPEAAYFDTITIFIALMLVGRWLQQRVLERNRNSLLASEGLAELYTHRFEADTLIAVAAAQLRTDDRLWIAPGDLVPVAGVLEGHDAAVSLDWITGEAEPIACAAGDEIAAGSFNAGTRGFVLRSVEEFSASRLHDLIRDPLQTRPTGDPSAARGSGSAWWHRVSTIYVTSVLLLAASGFFYWLDSGLQKALEVSVAVLVVTCPCALGLAVPLGREMVHVALRRRGVLLRRSDFLDRALRVRQVIFDKTGTLTRGRLILTDQSRRDLLNLDPVGRNILWNLTCRSNHPVSRSVAAALGLEPASAAGSNERAVAILPASDQVGEIVGDGLIWHTAGHTFRFGRFAFATGNSTVDGSYGGDDVASEPTAADDAIAHRVHFTRDRKLLASLEFQEDIRPNAALEVDRLRRLGLSVHMLSGDVQEKVRLVARAVGIHEHNAHGGLSPEEKAALVARMDNHDSLMVGDGLNDSLSFDTALCSATPAVDRAILPEKSDFFFLGDGIGAVRLSLQAARHLQQVQAGNLTFAALYNACAVGLCFAGFVSPVVAAILMPLSSVAVVLMTGLRLGRKAASWTS